MLLDRTRTGSASHDLEAQGPVISDYVRKDDGLLRATKKLWDKEGFWGFAKGLIPYLLQGTSAVCAVAVFRSLVSSKITFRRAAGVRGFFESWLLKSLGSFALCGVLNPTAILWTRMRLSPSSRTTKEEFRYLWLRMSLSDWFGTRTILPAFFYCTVLELVDSLTSLVLPTVGTAGLTMTGGLALTGWARRLIVDIVGSALSFPFYRCQELAIVSIKPMEEATIPIAEYDGLADEIVKDSAWDGLGAYLESKLYVSLSALIGRYLYDWL